MVYSFYNRWQVLFNLGIGFALQLKRANALDAKFLNRYSRRLGILFIIGLLHAVFFYVGDILMVYALIGFILLLFRKASGKFILSSIFILILLPLIQYFIMWVPSVIATPQAELQGRPAFFDQIILAYQAGSLSEIVTMNIGGLIMGRWPDLFFTGRFFRVLAMFLLGFYITRKMLFFNIENNRPFLKRVMIICAIIGIPSNLVLAQMMETNAYYAMLPSGIIQPLVYAFGVPALGLFYAIAIALLYEKQKFQKPLNIFAPVGQMALTNYLMQSVICCFIFMSYGLGYFATTGPATLTLIAILLFASQIIFSYWWLKYFKYGPMEWVWRCLTYRKWQPFIKPAIAVSNA